VSDRRGRAIGVVFVLVVALFLLKYLAQFWEPAQKLARWNARSIARCSSSGTAPWPWANLLILLSASAISGRPAA